MSSSSQLPPQPPRPPPVGTSLGIHSTQGPSFHPPTPIKVAWGGSKKFVRYVPPWTDPDWEDTGPSREKSDWKIRNGLMDQIRPAMLARDLFKNPTEYAKRFGIFPGRTDGRSRTSPTRSASRQIFKDGERRTGKEIFDLLEDLATKAGKHVDDYMADERLDMKKMSKSDQTFMQMYEALLVDEYWQTILFGNLTMNEVLAEDYFATNSAFHNELSGDLDPLLLRTRWVDTSGFGDDALFPHYLYSIKGERGEYDPRLNDKVWDAMQPALQMTSRLLAVKDSFLDALKDVTNRTAVDPWLDTRKDPEAKLLYPFFKFKRVFDAFDVMAPGPANELRNCNNFDPKQLSWTALARHLEFQLFDGNYNESHKFKTSSCLGSIETTGMEIEGVPITVNIEASLVWHLMVDEYSPGEKMMASLILAVTIVHELMHAWLIAPFKWLNSPADYAIYDPKVVGLCNKLLDVISPDPDYAVEPFFEDDAIAEGGSAFETHVMGGSYFYMSSNNQSGTTPLFLDKYAGIAVHANWPDGEGNDEAHLAEPDTRIEQHNHYIRLEDARKYFRNNFWEVAIAKYGTAALRVPPAKPHKIFHDPAASSFCDSSFLRTTFGTEADRKWIQGFLTHLQKKNQRILSAYLQSILFEARHFELLIKRMSIGQSSWQHKAKKLVLATRQAFMVILEFSAFSTQTSQELSDARKANRVKKAYEKWDELMGKPGMEWPDEHSLSCCTNLATFSSKVTTIGRHRYDERVTTKIMDVFRLLEHECAFQESLAAEFYELPRQYWTLFNTSYPNRKGFWVARVTGLTEHISSFSEICSSITADLPSWSNRWAPRLLQISQRLANLRTLLELDPAKVHANWRDMLVSLPALRKSRHKAHERWYFLAKKEMMSSTGEDLAKLKEFKTRFQDMLSLGPHMIALPDANADEVGLAQRWGGLLDDVMEQTTSGSQLSDVFAQEPVRNWAKQMQSHKENAQQATFDAAMKKATESSKEWKKRVASGTSATSLQNMAQSQRMSGLETTPKVGRITVDNFAVPFGVPQSTGSGATSSWMSAGLAELAEQVNTPLSVSPPQPVAGVMSNAYATRETITDDLTNAARFIIPNVDVSSFANMPPRDSPPVFGQTDKEGRGVLGTLGPVWERKEAREEKERRKKRQRTKSPSPRRSGSPSSARDPAHSAAVPVFRNSSNNSVEILGMETDGRADNSEATCVEPGPNGFSKPREARSGTYGRYGTPGTLQCRVKERVREIEMDARKQKGRLQGRRGQKQEYRSKAAQDKAFKE